MERREQGMKSNWEAVMRLPKSRAGSKRSMAEKDRPIEESFSFVMNLTPHEELKNKKSWRKSLLIEGSENKTIFPRDIEGYSYKKSVT